MTEKEPLPKTLFIKTYGCQMNVYDSARMADVMAPLGYQLSETYENADLVILNTCHIREKADEKVYSDLGRIRKEKRRMEKAGERMLIAVGGCVGQAEGEEILRRAEYVDMVMGPQTYHQLPEMVTRALRDNGSVVELDFPTISKFDYLPEATNTPSTAFLTVQEGCDKFCTFCVVPYTRGAEYSRPVADIEKEARMLVEKGAVELTLLGQNVNAYHGAGMDGNAATLGALIRRLAKIDGLERIRYTTSHPRDMDADLIAAHGEVEKLMPFLHLPVQSGSDSVLKRMNRKHNVAFYLDVIERLRKARPDIAFSSDFIVGFPGEGDAEFRETLELVRTVGFAQAYSFKYSPRPGTPASTDDAQVEEDIKNERLAQLQALLNTQQESFNASFIGKNTQIILEKPGKKPGQFVGKTPHMQSVHVMGAGLASGQLLDVIITSATGSSLGAEIINPQQENQAA